MDNLVVYFAIVLLCYCCRYLLLKCMTLIDKKYICYSKLLQVISDEMAVATYLEDLGFLTKPCHH